MLKMGLRPRYPRKGIQKGDFGCSVQYGTVFCNVFSKNGNINNLHLNMRSIVDLFHIRVLLYQKWSIMKTRSADKPTVYMYVAELVSCTMTKIKYISKVQNLHGWLQKYINVRSYLLVPTPFYCLCLNSASLA